ncbi:MAG: hypothetical protein Q8P86_02400 [bacterium]|nr:hypothetical protein [bacterium]
MNLKKNLGPLFLILVVIFAVMSIVAVSPVAFAQEEEYCADGVRPVDGTPCDSTIGELVKGLNRLLNILFPFIVGLAVFVIIFNIFIYITQGANEEKRKEAAKYITFGIIGVFLMLSLWGIILILVNTFHVDRTIREGDIPQIDPGSLLNIDKSGGFYSFFL